MTEIIKTYLPPTLRLSRLFNTHFPPNSEATPLSKALHRLVRTLSNILSEARTTTEGLVLGNDPAVVEEILRTAMPDLRSLVRATECALESRCPEDERRVRQRLAAARWSVEVGLKALVPGEVELIVSQFEGVDLNEEVRKEVSRMMGGGDELSARFARCLSFQGNSFTTFTVSSVALYWVSHAVTSLGRVEPGRRCDVREFGNLIKACWLISRIDAEELIPLREVQALMWLLKAEVLWVFRQLQERNVLLPGRNALIIHTDFKSIPDSFSNAMKRDGRRRRRSLREQQEVLEREILEKLKLDDSGSDDGSTDEQHTEPWPLPSLRSSPYESPPGLRVDTCAASKDAGIMNRSRPVARKGHRPSSSGSTEDAYPRWKNEFDGSDSPTLGRDEWIDPPTISPISPPPAHGISMHESWEEFRRPSIATVASGLNPSSCHSSGRSRHTWSSTNSSRTSMSIVAPWTDAEPELVAAPHHLQREMSCDLKPGEAVWKPEVLGNLRIQSSETCCPLTLWSSTRLVVHSTPLGHLRFISLRQHSTDHRVLNSRTTVLIPVYAQPAEEPVIAFASIGAGGLSADVASLYYRFSSTADMFAFQKAFTGSRVLLDEVVRSIRYRRGFTEGGKSFHNPRLQLWRNDDQNLTELIMFLDQRTYRMALGEEVSLLQGVETPGSVRLKGTGTKIFGGGGSLKVRMLGTASGNGLVGFPLAGADDDMWKAGDVKWLEVEFGDGVGVSRFTEAVEKWVEVEPKEKAGRKRSKTTMSSAMMAFGAA